jgi:cysteine desulfuration protein SufE
MDTHTLIDAFEHLDTWEERYELISELSRGLLPLTASDRIDANLIKGCDTRTWLTGQLVPGTGSQLEYRAEAEGPLVQGLTAVLLMPFQGKSPEEVLATDPYPFIRRLGLESGLSAKRQAGMQAFIERVKAIAARYCDGE